MNFHSKISQYESLCEGGDEAEHPSADEDCIDLTTYPGFKVEYLLSKSDKKKGNNVVFSRYWCCGFKCSKNRETEGWNDKRVKSCQDFMESKLSYDMYEDIHQVANYCQIKYD